MSVLGYRFLEKFRAYIGFAVRLFSFVRYFLFFGLGRLLISVFLYIEWGENSIFLWGCYGNEIGYLLRV